MKITEILNKLETDINFMNNFYITGSLCGGRSCNDCPISDKECTFLADEFNSSDIVTLYSVIVDRYWKNHKETHPEYFI